MKTRPTKTIRPPDAPAPTQRVTEVTSLAQLAQHHNEPIGCTLNVYGREWHFRGRRLNPAETLEIASLIKRAIPPRKDGSGEYDFEAPGYLEQREKFRRVARARCLVLAFPALFVPPAGLDLDGVTAFVEAQALPDEVLETLFGVATTQPVSLVELTGFISGSNSPKS